MSRAARGLVATPQPRVLGLDVWACLDAIARGDVERLEGGSSNGLSRAYHVLEYLQFEPRCLQMLALAVDEDVLVDAELQEWSGALRKAVKANFDRLKDLRYYGLARLEARGDPQLALALSTHPSPMDVLDAALGRVVKDASSAVVALAVTMSAAPDVSTATAALARARTAFPRITEHAWVCGVNWLAGWSQRPEATQWAKATAATAGLSDIGEEAARDGLEDKLVTMSFHWDIRVCRPVARWKC
jgi:hypothetical protein